MGHISYIGHFQGLEAETLGQQKHFQTFFLQTIVIPTPKKEIAYGGYTIRFYYEKAIQFKTTWLPYRFSAQNKTETDGRKCSLRKIRSKNKKSIFTHIFYLIYTTFLWYIYGR